MTDVPEVTERTKRNLNLQVSGWMFMLFGALIFYYGLALGAAGITVQTVAAGGVTGFSVDMTTNALVGPGISVLGTLLAIAGNDVRKAGGEN